ncbi:MAG: hypothetical protein QF723_07700, partial [Phycisphaerales bacterium]|nr:hypothetical protein [Phycisphaerales bacterium]
MSDETKQQNEGESADGERKRRSTRRSSSSTRTRRRRGEGGAAAQLKGRRFGRILTKLGKLSREEVHKAL